MFSEIEKNLAEAGELVRQLKAQINNMNVDGNYCPKCNSLKSKVIDIRANKYGVRVRRRQCKSCAKRWNTIEVLYED